MFVRLVIISISTFNFPCISDWELVFEWVLRPLSGAKRVLRSTTTNTMTSLLRGLIGSGGQAEEPTGVETVRTSLSNRTNSKLEKFQE